ISVMSALNVQLFCRVGKRNCVRSLDLMLRRKIKLLGLATFFQALPEPQGVRPGRYSKVRKVATNNPPMMVIAIGPQKAERDSGIMARIAASAVSTTGRARRTVASTMASRLVRPSE